MLYIIVCQIVAHYLSRYDRDFTNFTSSKNNADYYDSLREKVYGYFDGQENLKAGIDAMTRIFLGNLPGVWKGKLVSELVENQLLLKGLSNLLAAPQSTRDLIDENLAICFVIAVLVCYRFDDFFSAATFKILIFECVHEAQQRLEAESL